MWKLKRRPSVFLLSENTRKAQQTRNGKYLPPEQNVQTKQVDSIKKIRPWKFRTPLLSYKGRRASEAQRKRLFITTTLRKAKNHTEKSIKKKVLSKTFRLTDKCHLTRQFQRFNKAVIIMQRQTLSGSNLRGTPMAVIIMIKPHTQ